MYTLKMQLTYWDNSGSMQGTPEIWSNAVALAIYDIAKTQKRDFVYIHFASGHRDEDMPMFEFKAGEELDINKLVDCFELFLNGGWIKKQIINLTMVLGHLKK